MSMIVVKTLLYGELPSMKDSTNFVLLAIHSITFLCLHSKIGCGVMDRLKNNSIRKVIQESFKGYGKSLSLLVLVHKGLNQQITSSYFIWVLIVRGSASALFKSAMLSVILRQPLKLKKPKSNLFFNTIPTICLYFIKMLLFFFTSHQFATEMQKHLIHFFIIFMVMTRCTRSLIKIIKVKSKLNKEEKKELKQRRQGKKQNKNKKSHIIEQKVKQSENKENKENKRQKMLLSQDSILEMTLQNISRTTSEAIHSMPSIEGTCKRQTVSYKQANKIY